MVLDGDEAVLDFNYAYNPSCAYNSAYLCPLAPRENWLTAPVEAGELRYRGAEWARQQRRASTRAH